MLPRLSRALARWRLLSLSAGGDGNEALGQGQREKQQRSGLQGQQATRGSHNVVFYSWAWVAFGVPGAQARRVLFSVLAIALPSEF